MYNRKFTPESITHLADNEIFVFGSNLAGAHGGGAARVAHQCFGAVWGEGVGLHGQSYAIPTMHGGVEDIKPYVDEFISFAKLHPELIFYVTKIGCGIAGFHISEIAPLFAAAVDVENIILPKEFVAATCHKAAVDVNSWQSQAFLDQYIPLMKQVAVGSQSSYRKVKELRTRLFRNTVELVNSGYYITEEGVKVTFDSTNKMVSGTQFYTHDFSVQDIKGCGTTTTVEVVSDDCMAVGKRLIDMGYKPAMLNMASRRNPGGGVATGAGAQEETIFKRSNLFRLLYQYAPYAAQYGITMSRFQYPLDRNFGGIYTPCVTIFREGEKRGYKLMAEPYNIAVISVAGMNRPDLTADGMIVPTLVEPIKNKIRTIFRLGIANGHDSLVLGALGCGAFRNPPRHVARLFHEVMLEEEFKNKYRHIVFAILEDHNSRRSHNPDGNLIPFKEEFE